MNNKLFLLFILMMFTANAGFCEQTRIMPVHDLMIKFTIAMAGVILASVVIWAGLAVYNKILIKNKPAAVDEILKTPKTVDEAVKFFISKNRLK